jgi:hypothetical protein
VHPLNTVLFGDIGDMPCLNSPARDDFNVETIAFCEHRNLVAVDEVRTSLSIVSDTQITKVVTNGRVVPPLPYNGISCLKLV